MARLGAEVLERLMQEVLEYGDVNAAFYEQVAEDPVLGDGRDQGEGVALGVGVLRPPLQLPGQHASGP